MATVDAIPDPLMIVDKDYNIIKANKALADLESIPINKLQSYKCYQAFANRSTPCTGCTLQENYQSKPTEFELDGLRKQLFHEVTAQPLVNTDGDIEGIVMIYRDRTEAKSLRSQLIQKEKLASIGLLAGGIAHELNNPLGGIMIFSQMLLREMPEDNKYRGDVVEIEAASQRCKEIVQSLLDFARAQPIQETVKEKINMTEAIESALKFSTVGKTAQHLEVETHWDSEEIYTQGSRNKVIQLFLNLFQNAFQAMPDSGKLTIRTSSDEQNENFLCEVSDTGIGISQDAITHIFDPFYTSKASGEGTGLGLSICHGIIEEMGGSISVDSMEGKGTTFHIVIPKIGIEKKSA